MDNETQLAILTIEHDLLIEIAKQSNKLIKSKSKLTQFLIWQKIKKYKAILEITENRKIIVKVKIEAIQEFKENYCCDITDIAEVLNQRLQKKMQETNQE